MLVECLLCHHTKHLRYSRETGVPGLRGLCYKEGDGQMAEHLTNAGKSILRRRKSGKHLGEVAGKALCAGGTGAEMGRMAAREPPS